MAEDYKPRPSGGSSVGIIVGIVAAVILLPLLCCGIGGLSFFWVRSEAVQVAPPMIQTMPAQPELEIPEEPGIVLPSDTPDATTTPVPNDAKPPE